MRKVIVLLVVALLAAAGTAGAAPTFSIDFQGPTAGAVSEGDILTPVLPGIVPPPAVVIPAGAVGLGVVPGPVGFMEVDALSYGRDQWIGPTDLPQYFFSVDEFAVGLPGVPPSSVTTEGAAGAMEASGDVYVSAPLLPGPIAPGALGINAGVFDGNGGLTPFLAPGLNLIEPNPPTPTAPDPGDNLDAVDVNTSAADLAGPVYFSLDSSFPDPLELALPANTGTALGNGFFGGDVLVSTLPGGPPALYAPGFMLGLSTGDQDDLDALILWENGTGVYEPVTGPYSWVGVAGAGPTDMLLYSVRRASAIIGTLDSLWGIPIEEGDILVPMGPPGTPPGIFMPAEVLGLATVRSGTGAAWGVPNPNWGNQDIWADDLDALDVVPEPGSAALLLLGAVGLVRKRRRA